MDHRKGLGSEHPSCDLLQNLFLVTYFIIWGIDSFVLHYSTIFAKSFPFFIRLFIGFLSLIAGIYLALNAHNAVFNKTVSKQEFITTGVYARVRHPMYLGTLLFCLCFFFATFSLLSFIIWLGFFVFYDKMATYEEKDLLRIIGKRYAIYQKQVPKWLPWIKKGS